MCSNASSTELDYRGLLDGIGAGVWCDVVASRAMNSAIVAVSAAATLEPRNAPDEEIASLGDSNSLSVADRKDNEESRGDDQVHDLDCI